MKDTGVSSISDHLDSFDLHYQSQVIEINDSLGVEYMSPPTVRESGLTKGIEDWLAAGNCIVELPMNASAGEEAIRTMLQSYKNTGENNEH
tara:strand:+ start:134 stop:406 length:273 start_codon:yes stop_codon:yes gene_type:complete